MQSRHSGLHCQTLRQFEIPSKEIFGHKMESSQIHFPEIYQTYEKTIFNYVLRMVQDRAEAEDLTQEMFVKVYQNLSDFRGESSLSTWLYRLATNLCLDHFRKKSYRQHKKTAPLEIPASSDGNAPGTTRAHKDREALPADEAVIKSEMNACIRDYIDQLPEDYRAVIILSELQELKDREIAEILECSLETVKIRLHRARKRLKEILETNCTFYHDEDNNLCCDKEGD